MPTLTETPFEGSTGPDEEPVPAKLGRFAVLRELGSGGMGVVYEAEQVSPRRRVAIKVLAGVGGNDDALRRFRFESEVLGRLRHPNIA